MTSVWEKVQNPERVLGLFQAWQRQRVAPGATRNGTETAWARNQRNIEIIRKKFDGYCARYLYYAYIRGTPDRGCDGGARCTGKHDEPPGLADVQLEDWS